MKQILVDAFGCIDSGNAGSSPAQVDVDDAEDGLDTLILLLDEHESGKDLDAKHLEALVDLPGIERFIAVYDNDSARAWYEHLGVVLLCREEEEQEHRRRDKRARVC